MKAEEKARELLNKYLKTGMMIMQAKQCALICVDEMQEHSQMIETPYEGYSNPYQFLEKVKQEIENI